MPIDERHDLDAAIDRVARAMTSAAPPGAMRRAVARRIASPAPSAPGWRPWVTAAVAAAVVVVVAAVWRERPVDAPLPRAAVQAPALTRTVQPHETGRPADGDVVPIARSDRPHAPTAARQTVTAAANDTVVIDPLTIDPIGSSGVEIETMRTPARVSIDPIALAPMRIPELGQQVE